MGTDKYLDECENGVAEFVWGVIVVFLSAPVWLVFGVVVGVIK